MVDAHSVRDEKDSPYRCRRVHWLIRLGLGSVILLPYRVTQLLGWDWQVWHERVIAHYLHASTSNTCPPSPPLVQNTPLLSQYSPFLALPGGLGETIGAGLASGRGFDGTVFRMSLRNRPSEISGSPCTSSGVEREVFFFFFVFWCLTFCCCYVVLR